MEFNLQLIGLLSYNKRMKLYVYVGAHSAALDRLLETPTPRYGITVPQDMLTLLNGSLPLTLTFIMDADQRLWVADQRSEHGVCARSQPVAAAGEITLAGRDDRLTVAAITNQSTGYCPEPDNWAVVGATLDRLKLTHPGHYTTCFHFRHCDRCGTTHVIKDECYECAVCQAPLNKLWNFERRSGRRYL
jgi:hypothetical protein